MGSFARDEEKEAFGGAFKKGFNEIVSDDSHIHQPTR